MGEVAAHNARAGPPLGVMSCSRRSSMTLTRDSPFPRVDIVDVKGLKSQAAMQALTALSGCLSWVSRRWISLQANFADCIAKPAPTLPSRALPCSLGAPACKQVSSGKEYLAPRPEPGHWCKEQSQEGRVAVGRALIWGAACQDQACGVSVHSIVYVGVPNWQVCILPSAKGDQGDSRQSCSCQDVILRLAEANHVAVGRGARTLLCLVLVC